MARYNATLAAEQNKTSSYFQQQQKQTSPNNSTTTNNNNSTTTTTTMMMMNNVIGDVNKTVNANAANCAGSNNFHSNASQSDLLWEYEEIVLERGPIGLGFTVAGGVDYPHQENDNSIYVTRFVPNGPAILDGRLKIEDIIVRVDDTDLIDVEHAEAVSALKNSLNRVQLLVKRRKNQPLQHTNLHQHQQNQLQKQQSYTQQATSSSNLLANNNELRADMKIPSSGTLKTSHKQSLYARALFDYDPCKDSGLPSKGLSFKFGEVLHIINASDDDWWQARRVLDNGQDEPILGIIPSSKRAEKKEKSRLKSVKFNERYNSASVLDDSRRKKISFSRRFPFMKSRENLGAEFDEFNMSGSRSNSRAILSSSITSINNSREKDSLKNNSEDAILFYEPVLLHEIDYKRPVALYGLKEEIEGIKEDLASDKSYPFIKMDSIVPYTSRPIKKGEVDGEKYHFVTKQEMERDLAAHRFIEAGKWNNHLYGTTIASIREVAESGKHCLLNHISPNAIKRLRDAGIHPIVVLIKPKSRELLLEMNKRWSNEDAMAAMDYCHRLEQDYGAYFTATITFDSLSPSDIYNEVLKIVEQQSQRRIWIPTTYENAING